MSKLSIFQEYKIGLILENLLMGVTTWTNQTKKFI